MLVALISVAGFGFRSREARSWRTVEVGRVFINRDCSAFAPRCPVLTPSGRISTPRFVERDVMEFPAGFLHCALMPANLITLAHFSVSSAMSLPKSAGEPGFGTLPNAAYRDLTSGAARPALISTLGFWMISTGVPFGAPKPPTALAS